MKPCRSSRRSCFRFLKRCRHAGRDFGPVLPILVVENMNEAQRFVQNREKPLACYIFTSSRKTRRKFVRYTSFGGGCVNDTVMHLTTPKLPFGGVGNSGMGAYHGKGASKPSAIKRAFWTNLKSWTFPCAISPTGCGKRRSSG